MKFKTKLACIYSEHKPIIAKTGSPVQIKYSSRFADDGTVEVYESGKKDFQSYIESFRDSCDLNKMVARYMQGDESALDRVHGVYMDVTQFPTTYAEMFNRVREAEDVFNALDPAVKEKFNNNPVQFFSEYGSKTFFDKIGVINPSEGDDLVIKKDEVKSDAE